MPSRFALRGVSLNVISTLHNRPNDFRPLLIAEGHYSILVSDYYSVRMISGPIQNFNRKWFNMILALLINRILESVETDDSSPRIYELTDSRAPLKCQIPQPTQLLLRRWSDTWEAVKQMESCSQFT